MKSDVGQVSIPPGWNLTVLNDSGVRATFYVTHDDITVVMTAARMDVADEPALVEAMHSSLENISQAELPPLQKLSVDNTRVYCASTTVFAGCGAVRPTSDASELVIAFAPRRAAQSLEKQGGIEVIERIIASSRDLLAGEPRTPRKSP